MKRIIILAVICLFATALSTPVQADLTVVSEYRSLVPGRPSNTVFWNFTEEILVEGGTMVEVRDRDQKMGCRAELFYNESQALVQADGYREVRGSEVCDARQYHAGKPAIMNHGIVPGDWLNRPLPFIVESKKREYIVCEQIGTARFAEYLEVQEKPISFAQALSAGMVRADLQDGLQEAEKLYLVEIKRRSGKDRMELLLQQLWAEDDRFWLFEAKNGRRSWRLVE